MKTIYSTITLITLASVFAGCGHNSTTAKLENAPSPKSTSIPSPRSQASITKYEAILDKKPNDVSAQIGLGSAYMQVGRETGDLGWYVKGKQTLKKAVESDQKSAAALHTLAYAQTIFHEFQDAKKSAMRAIEIDPEDATAYGVLADCYYELGDYEKAADAVQRMIDLKPSLASYSRGAQVRWIMGNPKGAMALMNQAISAGGMDPENTAWCRVQLGTWAYQTGVLMEAEQVFESVLASMPKYRHALAGLGRVRAAQGKYDDAIKLLEAANEEAPTAAYLLDLADLYAKLGNRDMERKAVARIQWVAEDQMRYGIGGNEMVLATSMVDHGGSLQEALRLLDIESKEHDSVAVHSAYAWALLRANRLQDAKREIDRALRTNAPDSLALYRAAKIEKAIGHTAIARQRLNTLLALNPNFSMLYRDDAYNLLARK